MDTDQAFKILVAATLAVIMIIVNNRHPQPPPPVNQVTITGSTSAEVAGIVGALLSEEKAKCERNLNRNFQNIKDGLLGRDPTANLENEKVHEYVVLSFGDKNGPCYNCSSPEECKTPIEVPCVPASGPCRTVYESRTIKLKYCALPNPIPEDVQPEDLQHFGSSDKDKHCRLIFDCRFSGKSRGFSSRYKDDGLDGSDRGRNGLVM